VLGKTHSGDLIWKLDCKREYNRTGYAGEFMQQLKRPISLLIADDQQLFRAGLVGLFSSNPGFVVLGQATQGKEALDRIMTLHPEVAIMNILMPVLDGPSVVRQIRNMQSPTEVIFLTHSHDESQLREAFESGGRGYLPKDCEFDELAQAVRKAAEGDYYISGVASPDLVADYVKRHLERQRPGGLITRREREIARLLADGYSTKEAATILNISPKTAETHRAAIMKKLNARNVTDIVKYCIRNRIIEI
jgi:DNA-binding NarL/FixJ family response regulator